MFESEMLAEVRDGLDRARGEWKKVCEDTDVDYSWLCKVAQGQIANPGVQQVERLHKYLAAVYPPPRDDRRQKPAA